MFIYLFIYFDVDLFRTFKRTPVQRTKLGASAHTHPVYCLDVIGSQNAHNLISVSTDGKMCSWSLDMLSKPQVRSILRSFTTYKFYFTFYFYFCL